LKNFWAVAYYRSFGFGWYAWLTCELFFSVRLMAIFRLLSTSKEFDKSTKFMNCLIWFWTNLLSLKLLWFYIVWFSPTVTFTWLVNYDWTIGFGSLYMLRFGRISWIWPPAFFVKLSLEFKWICCLANYGFY